MVLTTLLRGIDTLWHNYLPWTQAVVVAPLIARARSPWMKATWYLVLATTTVAFIVTSYYAVAAYFAYPKTTNIKLFYETEAPFPAVTVCNLNPFKKSAAHHSPELTNLLRAYTYVNKVKQGLRKNKTTAADRTTTGSLTENHARGKRQDAGTNEAAVASAANRCETPYAYWKASQYRFWRCLDRTVYMEFGGDDSKDMADFNDTCRQKFCIDYHCASCSVVQIDGNTMGMNAGHYCKCGTSMTTVPQESTSPSTTLDTTTFPSTSTPDSLTSTTEVPTTTTEDITTTSAAQTTTSETPTTITESITTTVVPSSSTNKEDFSCDNGRNNGCYCDNFKCKWHVYYNPGHLNNCGHSNFWIDFNIRGSVNNNATGHYVKTD